MTPAQRAAEFALEFCPAGEGHDPGVDRAIDCQKCREEAFRACAAEALDKAAGLVERWHISKGGFTEIAWQICSLKSGGTR